MPLELSLPYFLTEVLLALLAFAAGVVCALWYGQYALGSQESYPAKPEPIPEVSSESEQRTERADMAVLQLRDLARNVAQDVGTHNRLVTGISDRLGAMSGEAMDLSAVTTAVGDILAANTQLQNRLESAERKIESQQEELRAQQTEARTDSLTGLSNRRELDVTLEKQIKLYRASGRAFSLLMFDVDHFKEFNDDHGHLAGDEVLRRVAQSFRNAAKSTDLACRYGGEEFALVMPHTSIGPARVAAERVRAAIEGLKVRFDGKTLSVTASVGVAEFGDAETSIDLLRRADESVYAAKANGRNRSYWHDGQQTQWVDPNNLNAPTSPGFGKEMLTNSATALTYQALPDWGAFSNELGRRMAESHRFGLPLTLMYLKVEDYADLEEEYGFAVGEMMLNAVTQSIRNTLRDMDLLGRIDANDFVVMLPGSTVKEASIVGARVQARIASCVVPIGLRKFKLVVHQGITSVKPQDDVDSLVTRAKGLLSEIEVPA